jgi:glutamate/aspartate transport system permease protein
MERATVWGSAMFSNFDFDVIWRTLPYLFFEGLRFTLMLSVATAGGSFSGRFCRCPT